MKQDYLIAKYLKVSALETKTQTIFDTFGFTGLCFK